MYTLEKGYRKKVPVDVKPIAEDLAAISTRVQHVKSSVINPPDVGSAEDLEKLIPGAIHGLDRAYERYESDRKFGRLLRVVSLVVSLCALACFCIGVFTTRMFTTRIVYYNAWLPLAASGAFFIVISLGYPRSSRIQEVIWWLAELELLRDAPLPDGEALNSSTLSWVNDWLSDIPILLAKR